MAVAKRSHSVRTPEPANGDEVKRVRHDAGQTLASVTTTSQYCMCSFIFFEFEFTF